MVKAIVGANWGDEGKGKITDLLAEASDGPTPGTPSSVTTANLRSTNCPRVSFTRIPPTSSATVWPWT